MEESHELRKAIFNDNSSKDERKYINMNNKIEIRSLFQSLQLQMEAQLSTNRDNILHPGSKGDSLENVWIEWLRKYLPNRYNVDKAIVVDSSGNLSDQIDLVIYDQQYTPFVFTQNGIHYIPAEGVYAVFEVKPDLEGSCKVKNKNLTHIEYAGRKIESVRMLKRTSTRIVDRGISFEPRPLTKILGGILTSVNSIKTESTRLNHFKNTSGLKSIDLGCSVEFGSFYIDYNGLEDKKIVNLNDRIQSYYSNRVLSEVVYSNASDSLVTFFLQLSRYLQQSIGTVAAIDFGAYANAVSFVIDKEI